MAVTDLWHFASEADAHKAGVTEKCSCPGAKQGYPTKRHRVGMQWRVDNYVQGRRQRISFAKKTGPQGADAYDHQVNADLQRGVVRFDAARGEISFADYATEWVQNRYPDPNSRRAAMGRLNRHLIPFFAGKNMTDTAITKSTTAAFLAHLRAKPKAYGGGLLHGNTVEGCWVLLTSIMTTATEVDEIRQRNPCKGVPRPKRKRPVLLEADVWEPEVVAQLLELIKEQNAYHHPIAVLAATCGLRQSECFAVAADDITPLRGRLTVRHQVAVDKNGRRHLKPPKGGKVRIVALHQNTAGVLAAHIMKHGTTTVSCTCCRRSQHKLLFTAKGALIDRKRWNETVWHPVIDAAGLAGDDAAGLHQLRHHIISYLLLGGADIKSVQAFAGHSSSRMTLDIYGHLMAAGTDRVLDIIGAASATKPTQEKKEEEADHG